MNLFIVTPTYNRMKQLKELYGALCNQDHKRWKWIVVNDGSDANAKAFDFLERDNRIIVIHKKHEGVNIAREVGLAKIRDRNAYVVEIDDNDKPNKWCLTWLVHGFAKEQADVVYGDYLATNGNGLRKTVKKPDYRPNLFVDEGNHACGFRAYRLEAARSVGGWRAKEWPAGDYALFLRMEMKGYKFVRVPVVLGEVMVTGDSISVKYWPEQIEASKKYQKLAQEGKL